MYAHVENGKVTYTGSLPKNWRNVSGLNLSDGDNDYLKTLGWLPYVEVSVEIGADETPDGADTVVTETEVTATAKKRAMTDAEKTDRTASNLSNLRTERNLKLADTDFYALSDVTMSSAMTTYRQALRDLPANTEDPSNPIWPTKPGA
jgi:hypothetical protein